MSFEATWTSNYQLQHSTYLKNILIDRLCARGTLCALYSYLEALPCLFLVNDLQNIITVSINQMVTTWNIWLIFGCQGWCPPPPLHCQCPRWSAPVRGLRMRRIQTTTSDTFGLFRIVTRLTGILRMISRRSLVLVETLAVIRRWMSRHS